MSKGMGQIEEGGRADEGVEGEEGQGKGRRQRLGTGGVGAVRYDG